MNMERFAISIPVLYNKKSNLYDVFLLNVFPVAKQMRFSDPLRIFAFVRDLHTNLHVRMKYGNLCNKKCKHYRKFADNI